MASDKGLEYAKMAGAAMKYAVLLRGINVGSSSPRVVMKDLRERLEQEGFSEVSTYINSGNILLDSSLSREEAAENIRRILYDLSGAEIPLLIKTVDDMRAIAGALPESWQNDKEQKSDVAYLFPEIDSEDTIEELPLILDYLDIRYVPGAIIWNVSRENQNKSRLSKLAGHKLYKLMTIRNVNTARFLAE